MIDQPSLTLAIAPAAAFSVTGPLADRARVYAERVIQNLGLATPPACQITIESAPPEHTGLGVGTQLGLAVAAAITHFLGHENVGAAELARLSRRGQRSAIGAHGFIHGGLLVEAGKYDESLSPLISRVEIPADWRFVLLAPRGGNGISGEEEQKAFASLPPISAETTAKLCEEALLHLVPAAIESDFDRFSESLYRFGRTAGMCFAARQGGPFASATLAALVETIRSLGVHGVGQSSWGPTLFAAVRDERAALGLEAHFRERVAKDELTITIAAPLSHGAVITETPA